MPFQSRRTSDKWPRWLRRKSAPSGPQIPRFLDAAEFELAILKERARAERRDLTFCVIEVGIAEPESDKTHFQSTPAPALVTAFIERLRITDEVGVFGESLGVLLPETIPAQAAMVANDLDRIASDLGVAIRTDINVWPIPDDPASHPNAGTNGKGLLEWTVENPDRSRESTPVNESVPGADPEPADTEPADISDEGSASVALAKRRPKPQSQTMKSLAGTSQTYTVRALEFTRPVPKWKRALDIVGASAGLVVLSPILTLAAIAIRATSPGPVIYRQWREGKDGRVFRIWKFRTMRIDADDVKASLRAQSEQDGPAFKIKDDPRITKVGKYLRRSCIDELPQLVNVLKGEMSLVGPRPLPVDESLACALWQRRRLDVLPGMTCTWQVDGGRTMSFDDWMRLDIRYVTKPSLSSDVGLLARTFIVTVLHRGSV